VADAGAFAFTTIVWVGCPRLEQRIHALRTTLPALFHRRGRQGHPATGESHFPAESSPL